MRRSDVPNIASCYITERTFCSAEGHVRFCTGVGDQCSERSAQKVTVKGPEEAEVSQEIRRFDDLEGSDRVAASEMSNSFAIRRICGDFTRPSIN